MRQPIPFGKYVLLERISVGGMAEVFKAKSFGVEGFEKILAIKRILPSLAEDADFIEMFIDEAKICGQLNHANICQIFELGCVGDSHFIAMEYVWGKDVLQIQNRFRKTRQHMRPEMAALIATKLCEGLDYAHKKKDALGKPLNIIHRDISPQNILISYEGELKIIDFGIAKAASRSSKTQAGVLKGKFGYMSPEQVRGLPLDRRSDVFAIGTILYELLISDRLFVGESDFETLEKVRNVGVPPPRRANPNIPERLEQIILRALARDVDERYQWASEMQEDLQAFLHTYEPVYTAKHLAGWMREAFAAEMRREQEILDEQRRIGRDVLAAGSAEQASAPTPVAPAPYEALPANPTRVVDDADLELVDDEEDGEKTTVAATPFGGEPEPAKLPDEKTAILADGSASLMSEPMQHVVGVVDSAPAGGAPELQAEATVILGDGAAGAGPRGPTLAGPLLEEAAPKLPLAVAPSGTGQVSAPPLYPSRSTLWKDILIGVGVAVVLVAGVLGGRAWLQRSSAKGTLVVMATPAVAAEVIVDGIARGHLVAGRPLTLKDLPEGEHAVVVRSASGEFQQTIQLRSGDVSVLSAALKLGDGAAGVAEGRLKLNLNTDGAQVYLDGAELADDAWQRPIPLRADVPHEIRVTKPGREEVKLAVTVQAGEEATRDVQLVPGLGKLTVSTDPAGAEVSVNGKRAGLTPISVGDIDPGKPARVTVRHKGFAPVTRQVSFDKGLAQKLELKLAASGSGGSGAGVAEPAVARAEKAGPKPVLADITLDAPKPKVLAPKEKEDDLAQVRVPPKAEPTREVKAAANDPGYLVANTQPWAKVIIDGKDTGKTTPIAPRSKIPLKPGKHVVTFVANGKKYSFDVLIKPNEDTRLIKQLTDSGP